MTPPEYRHGDLVGVEIASAVVNRTYCERDMPIVQIRIFDDRHDSHFVDLPASWPNVQFKRIGHQSELTFLTLWREVLRDSHCRRGVARNLAIMEANGDIGQDAVDEMLPLLAPHLQPIDRAAAYEELKRRLAAEERARQGGDETDTDHDARIDDALAELTGERRK